MKAVSFEKVYPKSALSNDGPLLYCNANSYDVKDL